MRSQEKNTAIARRQQNFTKNWPYLPKLIFPFDYTNIQTSTMHFIRFLMKFLKIIGAGDVTLKI